MEVLKESRAIDAGARDGLAAAAEAQRLNADLHRQVQQGAARAAKLQQHAAEADAQVGALKMRLKKAARRIAERSELLRLSGERESELRGIVAQLMPSLETLQAETHDQRRSRAEWEESRQRSWDAERADIDRATAQLLKQ